MYVKGIRKKRHCLISKLICILLVLSIALLNTSFSFAAFESIEKTTFTASVTLGGGSDADFDAMPDGWETQYGLDPDDHEDAYLDNDNDGFTNLEEYRNNSDPTDSESGIIVSIISSTDQLDVTLTADVSDDGGYEIVKYEWDFDGNGTYDHSSTNPSVEYKYTISGTHNTKLRVTNSAVGIGIAYITINATAITTLPDIITDPTALQTPVPYTWLFSGTRDDAILRYQWDVTGNGEYEFNSKKSPSISHSYKDVRRRSFNSHLKATDANGLSDIGVLGVDINSLSWYNTADQVYRPKVFLQSYFVNSVAGSSIAFSGYGAPAGGNSYGYATKLEWDFESDGIYDWTTDINNPDWNGWASVTHTYNSPGIYRATLRVTTEANVSATDHVLIIVEDSGGVPPTASATVSYRNNHDISEIDGTLPVNARFDHSGSSGSIVKYEWDFNGDKIIDYIATPSTSKGPRYHYRYPGYYLASLKVTDENALSGTFYIPVFVYMPDTYASIIISPEENQTIAGNRINLICDIFPDDIEAANVTFQYREDVDDAPWFDIQAEVKEAASYTVSWDTTTPLVPDGDYLIRAIVNGEEIDDFEPLSVTVGNSLDLDEVDVYEDDTGGTYTKITEVDPDEHTQIILSNGTTIDIPAGSFESDGPLPKLTITESTDSAGIGNAIDIFLSIAGLDNFTKDITITMPYPDEDNDGIIDGTGRPETDISIMWKNDQGIWEPLRDSVIYTGENYVSAKVNHFSLFGAGFFGAIGAVFGGGSASAGDGDVSYCFIATAAYGSAYAEDVAILKEYRDKFLLNNALGREFVRMYYKYSPKAAEYIEDKPALRKITRGMLKPIVKFAKHTLRRSGLPAANVRHQDVAPTQAERIK